MANDTSRHTALERARMVQNALTEAVRRSRLSSKSRLNYDSGSFSRRRGARLWSAFYWASLMLVWVLPSLGSAIYFGLLASPQFVVTTKFTVQGGDAVAFDGFGVLTGLPSANIVQDTQVVTNYIESQAIVEALQADLDIRRLFGSSEIDWLSRFDVDQPMEKLLRYWKSKVDASIQLPGGIVTVTIKAFSADDSFRISRAVLHLSEGLINNINRRMLSDNMNSSQHEFDRAAVRLGAARLNLEKARNREGMLDANRAGKALSDLVTELRGDQLRLQQDYASQSKIVSPDAPQMRALDSRIKAIGEQIRNLAAQMTSQLTSEDKTISQSLTRFSELELEGKIAERQYASAAAGLELTRATSERKLVFLQVFLQPSLPEYALYPKRLLNIAIACFGTFLLWATLVGLTSLARNHMA